MCGKVQLEVCEQYGDFQLIVVVVLQKFSSEYRPMDIVCMEHNC